MIHGGTDVIINCARMDGKMSTVEKIESGPKLQAGSKSAIELSAQCVQKDGTVVMLGVYGA